MDIEKEMQLLLSFEEGYIKVFNADLSTSEGILYYIEFYKGAEWDFLNIMSDLIKKFLSTHPDKTDVALDAFNKYHLLFVEKFKPPAK